MKPRPSLAEILAFNLAIVGQGRALAGHYAARAEAYAAHVGPHLRHVIEHYEALLARAPDELVDYDHRPHDRRVEGSPELAIRRFDGIAGTLAALDGREPGETVSVGFMIGVDGSEFCISGSTLARELLFVASHAVHHYAILRPIAEAAGIALPAPFGKAPETVRHERLQWAP